MRTDFVVSVDNNEHTFKAETWQDAMQQFLLHLNKSGFDIEAGRLERIVELASSGTVTVK